ncbi:hypothetical protein KCP78_02840 [Salmonella enterica subsp. enterica]|nr:hypothetical protein KCP78_02840 [Salmonella enterica subsp. enterica]
MHGIRHSHAQTPFCTIRRTSVLYQNRRQRQFKAVGESLEAQQYRLSALPEGSDELREGQRRAVKRRAA